MEIGGTQCEGVEDTNLGNLNIHDDDDHPYIIKMPDIPPVTGFGLGYEIFHGMKQNSNNLAQHVVEQDESQTYAELLDLCTRVAVNLKKQNLADDDIIGLCVDNHKHSCVPYVASLFLGYKVVAIDPAVTSEDKAKMLLTVTPKILFVDEDVLENMVDSLNIAKLNIKLVVIGENINNHSTYAEFLTASAEDINGFQPIKLASNEGTAIIFFGSGTTGTTKGICLSHKSLLARTITPPPVSMIYAQLNWISNTLLLLSTLRTGFSRVIVKKFEVNQLWKIIEKYKVNFVFASVFQIADIATSTLPKDVDISSLMVLGTGGSNLPAAIFEKLIERFPTVISAQGYGLTEIGGTALFFDFKNPAHRTWHRSKPTSCGAPVKGFWYKVVDVETGKILGPGEPGELRLKSKLAMVGYYKMDASDAYDSKGWFKTGDMVKYDEDQCFYIIDRLKEMIKYRCWIISPSTIEHVLMTHPAVDKAAVIGIPHEEESDYPMGIVTLKDNFSTTPEELVEYVDNKVIDRYKLRAGVKIINELPITSTGKIQKRILRRMVMDGKL